MTEHDVTEKANSFNQVQIDQFRANHRAIIEGLFKGVPMLLLTTRGARSGKDRVTPLTYTRGGNDYVVLAAKLGAPEHPA